LPYPINRPRAVAALAAAAALALPAAASAHVTIQPSTAPADGFTRIDVRVPNERDDAGTTKVEVQLPPGFAFVSYEPRPGWKVTLKKVKLDKPLKTDEGLEVSEGIGQITWTGDGKQGVIGPGEFVDFGLSVKMPPGKPGQKLTFKALQTYEGGEVVRWIGPESADEPAPTVTLTAAGAGGGHGAPGTAGGDQSVSSSSGGQEPAAAGESTLASSTTDSDGGGDGLAIAALIVGALGLLAGIAALATARRRTRVTT
jgi:periplasmic copper chaperone A